MRIVVQRVKNACVNLDGESVGKIGEGLLLLLGVGKNDGEQDVKYLVDKVLGLRIFEDQGKKMDVSIVDKGGEMLVVSQFTLYGDCRKGRRPSFDEAATQDLAEKLYLLFIKLIREKGINVQTGKFGSIMDIRLINSGPLTLLLDSKKNF